MLTPHIAGSTHEAQLQVALDVAEQVIDVLHGRLARYAINTPIIAPKDLEALTPYIDLAERLGHFLTQLEPGVLDRMELTVHGPIAELDLAYLEAAALKGLLDGAVAERVNLVNARLIARQRGISLSQRRVRHHNERYENLVTLTVGNGDRQRMVSGSDAARRAAHRLHRRPVGGFCGQGPPAVDLAPRSPRHRWAHRRRCWARTTSTSPSCTWDAARPAARPSWCWG